MSELLWVAVPGGFVPPSAVRIRVLVVPRLGAGTLADFGLEDWPETLSGASFELHTKTSDGIRLADERPAYQPSARSDLWRAFFGGAGGVINEWQPKSQPTPTVDGTHEHAQRIVGTYQTSAVTMAAPQPDMNVVRQQIGTWYDPAPLPSAAPPPPVPEPVIPDFHRTVATLREHPAVLRELGLIFDLSVDRRALDVGDPGAERYLSIRCPDAPLSFLVTSPWTRYGLTATGFLPVPADDSAGGIKEGMLDLGSATLIGPPPAGDGPPPPPWAITTIEIDGAVGRLRDVAKAVQAAGGADGPVTLPGLRSAGLMLVRPGRQADFAGRTNAAAARAGVDSLASAQFSAEDLVLGYRVDIRVGDDPTWYSLSERDAAYTLNGLAIGGPGPQREEGHIKPHAAVKDADNTLRSDEVVARWGGWSHTLPVKDLLARTPGPARNPDVELPYDFGWEFTVPPGRLPRLRFGHRYQMRVRIADVTGAGLALGDVSGSSNASDTILYARHEPVPPPVLQAGGALAQGAAIDRLVIRSDVTMTVTDLQHADPSYPATDSRALLPPTATFHVAEQHGIFDPPETDERTWEWARRAMAAGAPPGPGDPAGVQTGDAQPAGGLPDPASGGVNAYLRAEPGGLAQPQSERVDWNPAWPDQQQKLVSLAEQAAGAPSIAMEWSADRRTLTVRLAKAEQATIELSSTIRDGYADHFALVDWLTNAAVSVTSTLNGRHPLLTPARVVQLVHAVRRPLAEPQWRLQRGAVSRGEGETTAVLRPSFTPDGLNTDSTGVLEVAAQWQEWTDAETRDVTVNHLHSEPISRGAPPAIEIRHAFGDTKHRTVTYTLTAISRFRQYFHDAEPDEAFRVAKVQPQVNILSSARPAAPVILSATPAFLWQFTQGDSGRLERKRLGHRLRVEVARPWFETGEGERLAVIIAPAPLGGGIPVTQFGRDPLWGTPATAQFPPADWLAGAVQQVTLPELSLSVQAVPYAVVQDGDRWYADIEFAIPPAAATYGPFVQLALARFQPDSLPGLSLSPVVASDPVRLMPDRQLTVERAGGGLVVSLTGTAPSPPTKVEALLERCDLPAGISPEAVDLISIDGNPAAAAAAGGVPAWRPVPGHVVAGDVTGTLPVLPLPSGTGPLRLRVREIEQISGSAAAPGDPATAAELRERTVFVDLVPIPSAWLPS